MKYYARIENNIVKEIIQLDDTMSIDGVFHTDIQIVPCDSTVQVNWQYLNDEFTQPAIAEPTTIPWASYQNIAKMLLENTDVTMTRIHEGIILGTTFSGAADVIAWAQYRKSLRTIVDASSGDTTLPYPTKPPYPVGT